MNEIKYTIEAYDDSKFLYGSTVLESHDIETVLALNDELFDEVTKYQVTATVDGEEVYSSHKFSRKTLDDILDKADMAIEKAIQ